jgi:hypothetical protein
VDIRRTASRAQAKAPNTFVAKMPWSLAVSIPSNRE